ncbi:GAF and ANTAR domain-containing protein [Nocardioides gilvus]|uniref:GAF and ANTAR domain-containing protein n=1 Tax=Nocardioides gilvus TaxID=1735589 RepID=UPI000D7479DB|nr:GAF and ANTAR domain-containing protein [Nocardioides gilvus]
MSQSPLAAVTEALSALAEVLYSRGEYDDVYAAVCRIAVDVVPGCDHACLSTLQGGGELTSHGATDAVASHVDRLESELREGPCYDAMTEESFQMDRDIRTDPSWPALAERVLKETPVRGMIGYRVNVGARKAGALNLFSDTPGGFDAEAADMGAIIAAFASTALGAAAQHERAETLARGLQSNREIGKAMGMLMSTRGISEEEAFDTLSRMSQHLNIKLAQLARQVVDEQMGTTAST